MNELDVIFASETDEERVLPGIVRASKEIPDLEIVINYASLEGASMKVGDLFESWTAGSYHAPPMVFISGGARSNLLTGVIKSKARIQDLVIGVPIYDPSSGGLTALLSIAEKSMMDPVLTVGVNNSYAAVNIAYRFMCGLRNLVIPSGSPEAEKLKECFGGIRIPCSLRKVDDISPDDLVVTPFLEGGLPVHPFLQGGLLATVDKVLKGGKGVQVGFSCVPLTSLGYGILNVMKDANATGIVTSQSYEDAVQMAAVLTRNEPALAEIYKTRKKMVEGLNSHRGLSVKSGEIKRF